MAAALSLGLGWMGGALSWALLGRLREHRTEPAGLCDWLLWAYLVGEGVVLGKDGSLLTGWSYRGPDTSAATVEDLDALSSHVSQAMLPLGNGWMLHWNAVRHAAPGYAPAGAFPDPVTALLDLERRRTYEASGAHFETDTLVTVSYLPPPDIYSRLARCFVQGERTGLRSWDEVLRAFLQSAGELERRLSAVLRIRRLASDELLTLLHGCLTGLDHAVRAPVEGTELDSFLADQEAVGGWRPRIGRMSIRVLAIQGFPAARTAGGCAGTSSGRSPTRCRRASRTGRRRRTRERATLRILPTSCPTSMTMSRRPDRAAPGARARPADRPPGSRSTRRRRPGDPRPPAAPGSPRRPAAPCRRSRAAAPPRSPASRRP